MEPSLITHVLETTIANPISDRIIRSRDERSRSSHYGSSRFRSGPYDHNHELRWCQKHRNDKPRKLERNDATMETGSRCIVPYEQVPEFDEHHHSGRQASNWIEELACKWFVKERNWLKRLLLQHEYHLH